MSVIYQIRIELAGSDPAIWRRLTVPSDTSFDQLHDIFQIAFDCEDDFPYEFIVGETRVRDFGGDIDDGDNPNDQDIMDTFLDELVTMVKATFIYQVDDRWQFKVALEDILNSTNEEICAVCIDGDGVLPVLSTDGAPHPQMALKLNDNLTSAAIQKNVPVFSKEDVNLDLKRYYEDWEEIYDESGQILREEEYKYEDTDSLEEEPIEYKRIKHLNTPQDLFNDESEKRQMQKWLDAAADNKDSFENQTVDRLKKLGYSVDESWGMIQEAFAVEMFYEIKYGSYILEDRYEHNLRHLPEKPKEIPSVQCACEILDTSIKGVPFTAIEYLHNSNAPEARTSIIEALKNVSSQDFAVEEFTGIWYACAAEGHICEELITPVINFYESQDIYAGDWIHEQGEYLIGKLAQKYPNAAVQKVLDVMELEARDSQNRAVYYLFDVFDFCEVDLYKDRLIALLKQENLSYHSALASTMAHLNIKEALPILKEQVARLKAANPPKGTMAFSEIVELDEAIRQLETGIDLYPDVSAPLCLSRGKNWREQFGDAEKYFYDDYYEFNESDGKDLDFSDLFQEFEANRQLPIIKENKIGRNDPCHCGSGRKYKKCCLDKDLHDEMEL